MKQFFALLILVVFTLGLAQAKVPSMPLKPLKKGALSGTLLIIDAGHGGNDPGAPFQLVVGKKKQTFYEASYTMLATLQLANLARAEGAVVWLTTYSPKVANWKGKAYEPAPLPRDAVYLTSRKGVKSGLWGLRQRIIESQEACKKYPKLKPFFISLHIDSQKSAGWAGGHVIVANQKKPPKIAVAISEKLKALKYEKRNFKKDSLIISRVRPIMIMTKGTVTQRVLLEMGIPSAKGDSWRLRSRKNTEDFLRRVVIQPLKSLA